MKKSSGFYAASELSEEIWTAFHALRGDQPEYRSPFFDPDFARLISDVRSDVRVLTTENPDGLQACWPMHIGAGNWGRAIGGPFSDRNGPVVREQTGIDLCKFLDEHQVSGYSTSGLIVNDRFEALPLETVDTHISDLTTSWDCFLTEQKALYPKYFKKTSRLERKLAKESTEVVFTFNDEAPDAFSRLIEIKREQFAKTNFHDVLAPDWVRNMLDRLKAGQCPGIVPILSTLRVDGRIAAAEFNLKSGDLLHGWLVGFDQEFAKYSPGNLLTYEILKQMRSHDLRLYDAGTGSSHYKKHFSNHVEPIAHGVIAGRNLSLNPANMLRSIWSQMEAVAPKPMSNQLARLRRRSAQIISTETELNQQILGFAHAAFPKFSRRYK